MRLANLVGGARNRGDSVPFSDRPPIWETSPFSSAFPVGIPRNAYNRTESCVIVRGGMGFDIPKATCGGILIALSVLVYALPGCHTDVVLAGTEPQRGERALTTPGSPTVRRRRLAAELRAIRDRRGESLQTVATGLGWSTSKLSRYELGIGLKLREVEILLDHYRVAEVVRENLLGLAEEALRKGWWEDYSDVSSTEYREFIGLEAEASSVAVWHVEVVTGLLQTERYARALMAQYSRVEPIAPAFIERRVELRMRRKQVLEQDPSVDLLVVLDESVLKRQFGDESVMYEQLQSLAAAATQPNISLRVLPLRAPHPVSAESFVIFGFGPTGDAILHDVVATEGLKEQFYIEDRQQTYLHQLVFDTLLEATLDADASRDLIIRTAEKDWHGSA
jgi:transcriptional regulator with XRE-family HTH domain